MTAPSVLHVDGLDLKTGDGESFVWRGTLTWSLYGRCLYEGLESARRVVLDRRSVGANTICCSLMLSWGFPFGPSHPQFWTMLTRFVRMCADEEMRLCLIVFADTKLIMPDQPSQLAHWQRVYTHLGAESHVTLVLANQPGHHTQSIDVMAFQPPPSVAGFPPLLAARENPLEDNPPRLPPWSFAGFCTKRNDPNWFMEAGCGSMWYVVNGFGSYPGAHCPTVVFESVPFGRRPEWTDPNKARQLGRSCCFRGTIGANAYSDYDARSDVYPAGIVRDCVTEMLGNLPRP